MHWVNYFFFTLTKEKLILTRWCVCGQSGQMSSLGAQVWSQLGRDPNTDHP
jgi:hypothetical protein